MKRKCGSCGKPYEAKRPTSKYCGETCRKRAGRARAAGRPLAPVVEISPGPVEPVEPEQGPELESRRRVSALVEQVRRQLEVADRVESVAGQQALLLAERMSSPFETGSAVSSLSKQLSEVMDHALKGVKRGDKLDELTDRRNAKRAGAAG